MNKSFGIILAALVVLTVAVTAWLRFRAPEKELIYQGKTLSLWLKDFDANQSSAQYAAAELAIRNMGTNVLPALIGYLQRRDLPLHKQTLNLKAKAHVLRGEVEYSCFWHRRAALACGALGEAGAPAFPALQEAINDPQAAFEVGNGLSRMMPASIPILTNVLATGKSRARARAADNLITAFSHPQFEPMARLALINALNDPDAEVRTCAASAFQFWNSHLDVIIPALTRALRDRNPSVRGNAASSLGNFGNAAKSAVPELLNLVHDSESYPRTRAAEVLKKIAPDKAIKAGVN